MELQIGVKVLLKNEDGRYLLLRRSPAKYPDVAKTELWDIPGGRIEAGKTLFDNLKREVKEEVNLELVREPKLVAAQDILRSPEKHVVRLTYAGEIEGEPRLDNDHTEFGWFTLDQLKNLDNLDDYFGELLRLRYFS
ncbi:NUDIX domain-containing protein [Candidatus Wolfebacteria bacterium]|nr:NUDIX domain-containing protein [Candidatus Wolfebacteria bacterium]